MYDRQSHLWYALTRLKDGYESEDNPQTMHDRGMVEAAEDVTGDHDEIMEALDALAAVRAARKRHTSLLGRAMLRMLGLAPATN